jgi:acetyl esterase/lipase
MKKLLLLLAVATAATAADLTLSRPGLFFEVEQGRSRLAVPLPVQPGHVYERATIRFRMQIGKLQPIFNSFVDLIRPAGRNYFAMQIRADRSRTLVDRMDHTQYGEIAPWKDNSEVRVEIVYDTAAGNLTFQAFNPDGSLFQKLVTPIANRVIEDNGKGIVVGFGIDKVYDNAYYPPWTWKYYDLDVRLKPLESRYWRTTYVYKTAGALPIEADVWRTPDLAVPRPVILWLHGGALIFGHKGNLQRWQMERFVDAGFTVVAANYRLAPETKLPVILEDLRDAWAWIREKGPAMFGADPDRMAVMGQSAGGYLTLTGGHRLEPRPKALVSFYGYGDIAGPWLTRPIALDPKVKAVGRDEAHATVGTKELAGTNFAHERFKFYAFTRQQAVWPEVVTGMSFGNTAAGWRYYSPLYNVDAKYPPTLLFHGDADRDVPVGQSELMLRQLKDKGIEVEFARIPNGQHMFDTNMKDEHAVAAVQKAIEFLKARLAAR